MDRTLASVEFSHPALRGASPVTVRQNLDAPSAEEEGTARWVWPGATATARWLCDRDRGRWLENKHVLELGSGTGLLGLVAARLGAASVTLTDLPSELDLLRANVALNDEKVMVITWSRNEDGGGGMTPELLQVRKGVTAAQLMSELDPSAAATLEEGEDGAALVNVNEEMISADTPLNDRDMLFIDTPKPTAEVDEDEEDD